MNEEMTEEELRKLDKTKIVLVDGFPCIVLEPSPPVLHFKIIRMSEGVNPFDELLKEIDKFMGDFLDADKERKRK